MLRSPDERPLAPNAVEVRVFGSLYEFAAEQGWQLPLVVDLDRECRATELAESVGIPLERIEGVFVDGRASPIVEGRVRPGSRVGFIPYGIPGPYRVLLGYRRDHLL